jgi:hypothetical protein
MRIFYAQKTHSYLAAYQTSLMDCCVHLEQMHSKFGGQIISMNIPLKKLGVTLVLVCENLVEFS